jgi:cyclic pyranopterin phosphate synthase
MTAFVDSFGRRHHDLRVSLIDKCNLRCTYCMPGEHMEWMPGADLLTADEFVRVIGVAVANGVTEVRLTGGEPLLRPDLVEIIEGIASLPSAPSIAITTNGIRLAKNIDALVKAGLQRINISLDTLDTQRFVQLTRRNELHAVLDGIDATIASGIRPIKLNAVLMRGINDVEAPLLLNWAIERDLELRFIEEMPLSVGGNWSPDAYVTTDDVINLLKPEFDLLMLPRDEHSPAFQMQVVGTGAVVGFISSISRPFCGGCDRIRLTADGQFRNCLFGRDEYDLRTLLRSGADDAALLERMLASVGAKRAGHGTDDLGLLEPRRSMHAIGG